MGKSKSKRSKRSLGALPNGLVNRKGSSSDPGNPFEMTARMKRPKHLVHNRPISKPKTSKHALESLKRRQIQLRSSLKTSKKANIIVDRRIGQYDPTMSKEDQMLARLVKERTRQSQRVAKFRLDDEDEKGNEPYFLTHKGKVLDPTKSEAIYSDDEDDYGNLEAVDTELHFGGNGLSTSQIDPYGSSSKADLSQIYGQRKTELDDLIARRKVQKAEKMQAKETQVETVEKMDEAFSELSQLLQYRKDQARPLIPRKPTQEESEMNEWNMEMKKMMTKPKKRATDRTKTPEEIATEESERLHELETRRLARMNGDFEEDDFSDISISDYRRGKTHKNNHNPDQIDDSDDDSFKGSDAEGRGYGLKSDTRQDFGTQCSYEDDAKLPMHPLKVGSRVRGNYRASEQFDGYESWYDGVISAVNAQEDGTFTYNVDYDDGDFEEGMESRNVRPVEKSPEEKTKIVKEKNLEVELQIKRNMARDKARNSIPFVFEVPTTLEALHDLISNYASCGDDASTIIERIYKTNSVRLDRRNAEKMQNFYDVLLRRFIAVGDAIFESGNGGVELGRYDQLNRLTKVMYFMAQDSPDSAGAVWSRRVGIFQNAHAKRMRDSEFLLNEDSQEEEEFTRSSWPSMGTLLLLSALGHVFPVTDRRHYVVTPCVIFLSQVIAQTPISSTSDIIMGMVCSGLLLEYSKDAKRVAPEAIGFLAGIIRLFAPNPGHFALPNIEASLNVPLIRKLKLSFQSVTGRRVSTRTLKLEREVLEDPNPEVASSILIATFDMIEKCLSSLKGSFAVSAEAELLHEVSDSILTLEVKALPEDVRAKLASSADAIADACPSHRKGLRRRAQALQVQRITKTLAPRMEDPDRYSMSRDKGKKSIQAAIDRTRREFKREHKAISRELRLDANFIENERRREQERKDSKAKRKRQKNFAWLEGEQATMNQQVRLGGGLLKGGGTGVARAKAATAKLGIKKGGKF